MAKADYYLRVEGIDGAERYALSLPFPAEP
jgi:hypothetical protein